MINNRKNINVNFPYNMIIGNVNVNKYLSLEYHVVI
jgi:hypothetical protein